MRQQFLYMALGPRAYVLPCVDPVDLGSISCSYRDVLHAGRKRPAAHMQTERVHSEALGGGHRGVLRGDKWKLQRVQSLSALPSDADLLAGLNGKSIAQRSCHCCCKA